MYEWIYLASIWGLSDEIWDFLQVNVTQSAFNPYNVVGHLIASIKSNKALGLCSLALSFKSSLALGMNFPMAPHSQLDASKKNNEKLLSRAFEM